MDLFGRFKGWLENEGRDEKTIIAYLHSIGFLKDWYEERTGETFEPGSITPLDLHDWKSYMETVKRYAPSTVNKHVAAIKRFWTFLIEEEIVSVDPTRKIKTKRSSVLSLAPRWLTRKEQAKLFHRIEKEKRDWKRTRDLAIAHCMINGGLRISETVALDLEDVELKRGLVTVRDGKGGKLRLVTINRDLSLALAKWIEARGSIPNNALFISQQGGRLTDRGVQHQLRGYLDDIGLTDETVHCLRHSFTKNLIDAGVPLQIVAQLSGHESIETTRRYTVPGENELRKAVESVSWEK